MYGGGAARGRAGGSGTGGSGSGTVSEFATVTHTATHTGAADSAEGGGGSGTGALRGGGVSGSVSGSGVPAARGRSIPPSSSSKMACMQREGRMHSGTCARAYVLACAPLHPAYMQRNGKNLLRACGSIYPLNAHDSPPSMPSS
eukprot:266719-Chlamydomonas_euryale.AAC.4